MNRLLLEDLPDLQAYEQDRPRLRQQVMALKRDRRVQISDHLTLLFENRDTIYYQVMEMLRIEKTTLDAARQEELDAYNPLIPTGDNWKATLLIEYADATERAEALQQLAGIEHRIWCQVGDSAPIYAIADEDMERGDETKTSAVHFLSFQLNPRKVAAILADAPVNFGATHPACTHETGPLPARCMASLKKDLTNG